jgi:hypothetical protein
MFSFDGVPSPWGDRWWIARALRRVRRQVFGGFVDRQHVHRQFLRLVVVPQMEAFRE